MRFLETINAFSEDAIRPTGILNSSDNSLSQHLKIKHPEHWIMTKQSGLREKVEDKVNYIEHEEFDTEIVEVRKKRSLSTNYEDDTINY